MRKLTILILAILAKQMAFSQKPIEESQTGKEKRLEKKNLRQKNRESYKNKVETDEDDDKIFLDFVGNGNIQQAISQGADLNANTGVGIIMERVNGKANFLESFELEGTINIATTADTAIAEIDNGVLKNRRNFGTYILNPISSKQSLYANANLYFTKPNVFFRIVSGAHARIISSNAIWKYNNTSVNLGAIALRVGVFHEFLTAKYRNLDDRNKYSVYLGANFSMRAIMGDLSAKEYESLRIDILGSKQTEFYGFELNFGFRLSNIRAEFQMSSLWQETGTLSIDGLTNTQFNYCIKFVGGFPLKLNL